MNHYRLSGFAYKPSTEAMVRATMLLYLAGIDFKAIGDEVSAKIPFSLDNIDCPELSLDVESSEMTNTIEGFDKPLVEKGDLVACLVPDADRELIKKWYDDYIVFNSSSFTTTAGASDLTFFIGISNSAKSEFNDPFVEAFLKVVAHPKLAEDVQIINQL